MPLGVKCDCTLCHIEVRLLSDLTHTEAGAFRELFSGSLALRQYLSAATLLSHLRVLPADARSDELLRELFASRGTNPSLVESFLVLAFLPMLHSTIRRVARRQEDLSADDIMQQALSFLLQYLRSDELRSRKSHFAFAISRAVKRQVFEWANRESGKIGMLRSYDDETLAAPVAEEPLERYASLHHFLHRCVKKGLLTETELNLLIQFRLDGNTGGELATLNGSSSNAIRQRFKRLIAKLRRLAQ